MAHLIEEITVGDTTLKVKFLKTLKTSAITNANFQLFENAATPVSTPFKAIDIASDYNSINRVLILTFTQTLKPLTSYTFKATGLKDAAGTTIANEECTFTTDNDTAPALPIAEPEPTPVEIEDHSIKADAFTSAETIYAPNPDFYIDSSDPLQDEGIITTGYNNGRVTIKFSQYPSNTFLNSTYFKAQRKKIQRDFTRWESVSVVISTHPTKPWVYIDFPSTDATPLYNTAGKEYFSLGYKYRVKISKDVAI